VSNSHSMTMAVNSGELATMCEPMVEGNGSSVCIALAETSKMYTGFIAKATGTRALAGAA